MNGLGIFDTNGRLQVAIGAHTVAEKGGGFYCNSPNGERRAGFGVNEDGTAGLDFSAAQKDRYIQLQAGGEGKLLFMFSGNEVPMATLGLTEGEDRELSANLALIDKAHIPQVSPAS